MKISSRQSTLLAKEIVRQLSANGVMKVSETTKEQLRQWKKKRDEFMKAEKKAEDARKEFDQTLYKITGRNGNIYAHDSVERICKKMEKRTLPSVHDIEDEIILKSMFKSEDDMEAFVNSIVKKYERKLQRKVLVN